MWEWEQLESFGSTPPNDNPSGLCAFEFALGFRRKHFDRKTNLAYN